jgi:hypothetical protein
MLDARFDVKRTVGRRTDHIWTVQDLLRYQVPPAPTPPSVVGASVKPNRRASADPDDADAHPNRVQRRPPHDHGSVGIYPLPAKSWCIMRWAS